ncbi:MAG: MerR family transcriptional regulator, partial [Pseudomonadales bacterium]|nr:MerR family transcriptional regulator [Pseudomonadales bacterium]
MLNSKQLIEITGISRATLNNYVALGILPNPVVMSPVDGEGRATRLGYFEDDAVDCIREVQELKKAGYSMQEIAEKISGKSPSPDSSADDLPDQLSSVGGQGSLTALSIEATIDNFPGPAYMVNNNFELIWWNEKSASSFFSAGQDLPGDLESRNLLKLLFSAQPVQDQEQLKELLKPHMAAAKKRLTQQALIKIYSAIDPNKLSVLKELYEDVDSIGKEAMIHFPSILPQGGGEYELYDLYICFYREGIL